MDHAWISDLDKRQLAAELHHEHGALTTAPFLVLPQETNGSSSGTFSGLHLMNLRWVMATG